MGIVRAAAIVAVEIDDAKFESSRFSTSGEKTKSVQSAARRMGAVVDGRLTGCQLFGACLFLPSSDCFPRDSPQRCATLPGLRSIAASAWLCLFLSEFGSPATWDPSDSGC